MVEVVCMGGYFPPRRKTRTFSTLPHNVRTCYCGESMETSHITTMGCTWTGELWMTPSGSVVGTG